MTFIVTSFGWCFFPPHSDTQMSSLGFKGLAQEKSRSIANDSGLTTLEDKSEIR